MRILPYKMGSRSARALADALDTAQVYREKSNFRNNYDHTIINWGCSDFNSEFPVQNWINNPVNVKVASNKLSCFNVLKKAMPDNIPEFTTSHAVACEWWSEEKTIVTRKVLTGHSGEGIVITIPDTFGYKYNQPPSGAPLYVKYIKKTQEYRVHVMMGKSMLEVIDVQQKRKRQETPNDEINYQVRNHSNGWVYCRENITNSPVMLSFAVSAVDALGLDFGAVDIIYNEKQNKYYVLEINTAVGLSGETITKYADGFKRLLE